MTFDMLVSNISNDARKTLYDKILNFFFFSVCLGENSRKRWNLDHIAVAKIISKCFRRNGCNNEEIAVIYKNLLSWHNIWNIRQIAVDIKEKLTKQKGSFVTEFVAFTFTYQTNRCHATELSTAYSYGWLRNSERHRKNTSYFTEIVRCISQIVR